MATSTIFGPPVESECSKGKCPAEMIRRNKEQAVKDRIIRVKEREERERKERELAEQAK